MIYVLISSIIFFTTVVVESTTITGPQKEVVSIYNNNFTTPSSRYPYVIVVYRCVKVTDDDFLECGSDKHPVEENVTEIEIVVPDLTNKDRRPGQKTKYYRHVVFSHISCKCVRPGTAKRKLYKKIMNNEVTEKYFKANYRNNPDNLRRRRDFCDKPQLRYKLHPKHLEVFPKDVYLVYQQCLPGCVVISNVTFSKRTRLVDGTTEYVQLTNDTKCEAYDKRKIAKHHGHLRGQKSDYRLLLYICSGATILVVFLLSLVLIILCRRRKNKDISSKRNNNRCTII